MSTGPFQYDPEHREFRRRGSARPWLLDSTGEGEAASAVMEGTPEQASHSKKDPNPSADPAPIRRRRRRTHRGEGDAAPKKSRFWQVFMWGLIVVLLVGWLVLIAMLTVRSGSEIPEDRQFEFDRGGLLDEVAPPAE